MEKDSFKNDHKIEWLCPHCGKETFSLNKKVTVIDGEKKDVTIKKKQFVFPLKDPNGKVQWNSVFRFDDWANWLMVIGLTIAFCMIFIGVRDINKQCYQLLEDPCRYVFDTDGNLLCNLNAYSIVKDIPIRNDNTPNVSNAPDFNSFG